MKPEFWWSVDCAQGQRFRTTTREGVSSHTNNITVLVTIPLTSFLRFHTLCLKQPSL